MLFTFSKYLIPGWQFHIMPRSNSFPSCAVSIDYDQDVDERYETKSAKLADKGYALWNNGALLYSTHEDVQQLKYLPPPTLKDEYTFIRKYWGSVWALYVLLFRLFSFHNPVKEFKNFIRTRHVTKYVAPANKKLQAFQQFQSSLIATAPLVAVIIPTLNRYDYLRDVLKDLENQTYKNIEVIVVDQSDNFNESFYTGYNLTIKLIRQAEKKLWTARNKAVMATNATYLLFFDDDSRVTEDWVAQHLKCLDYFDAAISAGISLSTIGGKIPDNYARFRWADQFDSGNAMVKRSVFRHIGLFDEQFNGMRMGDGEFGFRCYLHGYKSISNPLASRVHFKASKGGLREMGSWDGFRPKKWFAPKPVPSVVYLYKKYLPATLYKHALLKGIILSNVPYKYKGSSNMLIISMMLSLLKSPLLFIQFKRSEKIAMQMLQKDDGIRLLQDEGVPHAV